MYTNIKSTYEDAKKLLTNYFRFCLLGKDNEIGYVKQGIDFAM
jgi:hypothetical protein